MSDLVRFLSRGLRKTVIDETGLTGRYNFQFSLPEDDASTSAARPSTIVVSITESSLPAFSTALQNEVGLKVESRKIESRTLVIDRAEKPSENP
jgi:uncharacterized protein (TIGR03435 family)